jgi:uncharacterized protein (DUF1810 family)
MLFSTARHIGGREAALQAPDPFDLERFVRAQDPVHDRAMAELRAGRKTSHWMWFVFPQLRALGRSPMAVRYGIGSAAEARAYLAHPRLGPRLALATRTVMAVKGATLEAIFGPVDAIKFRSSMTLFTAVADEDDWPFAAALAQCCGGMPDEQTVALLRA